MFSGGHSNWITRCDEDGFLPPAEAIAEGNDLSDASLLRYSRHLLLPEIDVVGQRRMLESGVLVIGAGGLGSAVLLYLASAGVGRVAVVDDDVVDLSNLQRQIIHDQSALGINKAVSARRRMLAINPNCQVAAVKARLDGSTLGELATAHDIIVDCSDNFATRYTINAAAIAARRPLILGAAVGFVGQLAVFDARNAQSPCYHCLFPNTEGEVSGSCVTSGVLSPLVGVIGSLQAVETIKWLVGIESIVGRLTRYDALTGVFQHSQISRDPYCQVCRYA